MLSTGYWLEYTANSGNALKSLLFSPLAPTLPHSATPPLSSLSSLSLSLSLPARGEGAHGVPPHRLGRPLPVGAGAVRHGAARRASAAPLPPERRLRPRPCPHTRRALPRLRPRHPPAPSRCLPWRAARGCVHRTWRQAAPTQSMPAPPAWRHGRPQPGGLIAAQRPGIMASARAGSHAEVVLGDW